MKLNDIYLESIAKYDLATQDFLLREAPHARVTETLSSFAFLRGIVDFGFEDLGLPADELRALMRAYSGSGVAIPGEADDAPLRLRHCSNPDRTVIEPADGSELLSLPENWLGAVSVYDAERDRFTWVGHNVRSERVGHIDRGEYESLRYGLLG